MKSRYVLKDKRRFSLIIMSVIVTLFTFICAGTAYGYKEPAYEVVSVKSGDTLWGIASKYNKNEDIRKYIYKIKKMNNLASNEIYVGTQLRLPVN